jgi:hypothetical protein
MINELSEVLGRAWSLYRAHFSALYSIALAIWIPCVFFDAWFIATKPLGGDFATFPFNRPASNLIAPLAAGALFFYLREANAGRPVDPAAAARACPRYWGPMVAAQIMLAFLVGIGLLLLIVPGVYVIVRCAVALTTIVAEDVGAFEAFRRSFELTKGKFWAVLLWLAAGTIPPVLLGFLVIFPLALFLQPHDWIAQAILGSIFTLPLVFAFPLSWVIYARLEQEEVR